MNRLFISVLLGLSCASFTVTAKQTQVSVDRDSGKALFEEKCAMCHRFLGMGTRKLAENYKVPPEQAWLERRENLPVAYIEYVVRNGKGIMFSLSRAEVSDEQLKEIARYLARESE